MTIHRTASGALMTAAAAAQASQSQVFSEEHEDRTTIQSSSASNAISDSTSYNQLQTTTTTTSLLDHMNQDCWDLVGEFAAFDMRVLLRLRLVSAAMKKAVAAAVLVACGVDRGLLSDVMLTRRFIPRMFVPVMATAVFEQHQERLSHLRKFVVVTIGRQLRLVDFSTLELRLCDRLVEECAVRASDGLRDLRLNVAGAKISNAALVAVGTHCPGLERLNLSGVGRGVDDEGVLAIAKGCPNLIAVDLSQAAGRITDASLEPLVAHCPNLQELNLSWTGASDATVVAAAKNCPKLADLNLSWLGDNFTEKALRALAAFGPEALAHLDLRYCRANIPDMTMAMVRRRCPKARIDV